MYVVTTPPEDVTSIVNVSVLAVHVMVDPVNAVPFNLVTALAPLLNVNVSVVVAVVMFAE